MRPARDCGNMTELRVEIDALDRELVRLFRLRADYIDRAAELKPAEALPARIPDRVEAVVSKVRAEAGLCDLDPDLVEAIWRRVIDWSIRREEAVIGPGIPAIKE